MHASPISASCVAPQVLDGLNWRSGRTLGGIVAGPIRGGKRIRTVLSAIRPGGCWSPVVTATISGGEGVERGALPEMPIARYQRAA